MDRRVQGVTHAAGGRKLAGSRPDLEPGSGGDDGLQSGQFRLVERLVRIIPRVIILPRLFEMLDDFSVHSSEITAHRFSIFSIDIRFSTRTLQRQRNQGQKNPRPRPRPQPPPNPRLTPRSLPRRYPCLTPRSRSGPKPRARPWRIPHLGFSPKSRPIPSPPYRSKRIFCSSLSKTRTSFRWSRYALSSFISTPSSALVAASISFGSALFKARESRFSFFLSPFPPLAIQPPYSSGVNPAGRFRRRSKAAHRSARLFHSRFFP